MAYKRVSRHTSSGRQTTTFHTNKPATSSSSQKSGTNGTRITTTTGGDGKITRTETRTDGNGYVHRKAITLSPGFKQSKAPKPPKPKATKFKKLTFSKPANNRAIKTSANSAGSRSRSSGGSVGWFSMLLVKSMVVVAILVFVASYFGRTNKAPSRRQASADSVETHTDAEMRSSQSASPKQQPPVIFAPRQEVAQSVAMPPEEYPPCSETVKDQCIGK
jgi:hypothetical protein